MNPTWRGLGRSVFPPAVWLLSVTPVGAQAPPAPTPVAQPSVTVPFTLDHNRMTVEVEFARPDGVIRPARAWVDTGSEVLMMAAPLAAELGPGQPLRITLRGLVLDAEGVATKIQPGSVVLAGVRAEATLPASLLRRYQVVFDYPASTLTIARAGTLTPRGAPIPCRVNPETGLFMVSTVIDGDTLWMGVDHGSVGTWVSNALTARWQARHTDWSRATGSAGSTNFFGFPFETQGTLLRLPAVGLDGLCVREVAVLGIDSLILEWYSRKSAGPVAGFLGAEFLRGFRIEADFPAGMTYWEAGPTTPSGDLDIVGLTLRPEADGGYTIAGVVARESLPVVAEVRPGDRLLRVGALETTGAPMGEVVAALRGEPGSTRVLLVEREGEKFEIEATVRRLP